MKLVDTSTTVAELRSMRKVGSVIWSRAVVDVRRLIMAVDADLHSDEEALLIEHGSTQANAVYRGLELLDLTIADPRHRQRLKELTRLREVLLDYFFGPNEFGSSDLAWHRYFNAFGMAAALERQQARPG